MTAVASPKYDAASLAKRARGRVGELPRRLDIGPDDLRGRRVLEIGCGNGECTAAMIDLFDADAFGIDPEPRWLNGPYSHLGEQGRLVVADACNWEELEPLGSFDYVHSYTVFEHIERPLDALTSVFRALRPGGRAFLSFNLYLGASASHLAGYLPDMPWIHLTHTDEEARQIMKTRHGRDRGFSWVNKWTDRDYLESCQDIGFSVLSKWYMKKEPTEEFLQRHKDKLGKYAKADLAKNFMNMRLERPR